MTALQVAPPFPIFTDQNGLPLDEGFIYIGTINLNPETSPISVFWDAAMTQPAAQPIRTVNGYPSNGGRPAIVYVNEQHSLTVRNLSGVLITYSPINFGAALVAANGSATEYNFTGDGTTTAFVLGEAPASENHTWVFVSGVYQTKANYSVASTVLTFSTPPPTASIDVIVLRPPSMTAATDASAVTYTPSGAGAVETTVQAKLRQYPSIEDFGGSTAAADNAAALNLMLAATGDIYVGHGKTYHLKSALTRTGSLHMWGGGTLVWDSDATSSGLTVNLTTAEGYSDVCRVTDVAFESARAGLGDAITVDATAQISGSLQQRVFPRAFFTRVQVRGDGAASVGGWLNGINLIGASNTEINSCYFVGYVVGSTYGSASAVKIDDGGNTAVLNIKDSSFYYWDKAIYPNGCEGVNVEGCNIVSAEFGIYSRNTNNPGVTGAPMLFVQNNHINVRQRAVDVLFMQGLNISDNYIWQLSSSVVTGTGVYLEDCDDFIVSRNHFTANVGSGQDYRAFLSVDSTDGMVTLNHAQDVTQGFWSGTGSDNVVFSGNTVNKDAISNPEPILYVNTSADRVVHDNEKFSAKNASIVGPAASSTLATVNLGRVHLGQKFLVSAVVEYAKAAGDGITSTVLLSGGGTGTVVFSSDDTELREKRHQFGSTTESHTVSGVMTVTAEGTKTLAVAFSTAGGNNTIAAGEAQLTAVNLGGSLRLG